MATLTRTSKIEAVNKMTDLLQKTEDPQEAVIIFQAIDKICDAHHIQMPDNAVTANIGLDNHFGCDVLTLR